ncbi:ADP-L-glycero-D-manno-heptose-6-epimerase [Planctomycetes bacterium Pan216]|uniref:ADP-L-glycero-D-manno-heptose-6-epimerase n=1 Tax=Kolteria novifilia TaxID=2527975 RepID=A0A518B854_9BACT|nr:ADP-L-glycero-D-manno-heptose-6-epimerase [Planctomycetes bacterium Pan216]
MIVVTGGTGFIGSNLVAALEEQEVGEIAVVDSFGVGDRWKNLAKRELAAVVAPSACIDYLNANKQKVEMIFHMGAISSTTEQDVDLIIANNFTFSLALWHWCARNQVRFVYASSAATYGDGSRGFRDDQTPDALAQLRPLNAYGWSKHLFDRRIIRLASEGTKPPQWAGLKFFNVYGPNEYHKGDMKSVVAKSYPVAAKGETVRLFKSHHPEFADGGQLRDFVSVNDCVNVMSWLREHSDVNGIFNLGTGKARSFADLVRAVFSALGREPQIEYIDMPENLRDRYQYYTQAEMSRLTQAGYDRAFLSLEDGVADYVKRYLSQMDPYR